MVFSWNKICETESSMDGEIETWDCSQIGLDPISQTLAHTHTVTDGHMTNVQTRRNTSTHAYELSEQIEAPAQVLLIQQRICTCTP